LGLEDIKITRVPEPITYFNDNTLCSVYTVSSGTFHTIFLDKQGKVYAVGCNESGQLGLGDNKNRTTPEPIPYFKDILIKKISAGAYHTVFIDTEGKVYTVGSNICGQLGLGDKNSRSLPEPITTFDNIQISSVSAGGTHTVFIDTIGKVYAVGYNENEQLGIMNVPITSTISTISKSEVIQNSDIAMYWITSYLIKIICKLDTKIKKVVKYFYK
jgi:alpha-tubulin suppressor-like RCC1 family protein